jgi:hypothetical protein
VLDNTDVGDAGGKTISTTHNIGDWFYFLQMFWV